LFITFSVIDLPIGAKWQLDWKNIYSSAANYWAMWRLIVLLALLVSSCTQADIPATQNANSPADSGNKEEIAMKLRSDAFMDGSLIPVKYTCQGDDMNPALKWDGAPEGTKSFALIVDDPDAPMGTWIHWLVKGIPSNAREIKEDSVPGIEVGNSFGSEPYGGPCPPSGTHRYFFKLYALDVEMLDADNSDDFYIEAEKHKIAEAFLMGRYKKS